MKNYVKVDKWIKEILRDPLDKSILADKGSELVSEYGNKYPHIDGTYDFRCIRHFYSPIAKVWSDAEREHEIDYSESKVNDSNMYPSLVKEVNRDKNMYVIVPLNGRILDIGGGQGRIRIFLEKTQEYVSIDHSLSMFKELNDRKNLVALYPVLKEKFNVLLSLAEFLPFVSNSFDTVHLRSVIAHLLFPELVLLESYRVLRLGGRIIICTYIESGRKNTLSTKKKLKYLIKKIPILNEYLIHDHHIWHPTITDYADMLKNAGFSIENEFWSKDDYPSDLDNICTIVGIKR